MSTITACSIETQTLFGGATWHNEVMVTIDGVQLLLFTYYPDEITFHESEFLGLTEVQARTLHRERDIAYLRS